MRIVVVFLVIVVLIQCAILYAVVKTEQAQNRTDRHINQAIHLILFRDSCKQDWFKKGC